MMKFLSTNFVKKSKNQWYLTWRLGLLKVHLIGENSQIFWITIFAVSKKEVIWSSYFWQIFKINKLKLKYFGAKKYKVKREKTSQKKEDTACEQINLSLFFIFRFFFPVILKRYAVTVPRFFPRWVNSRQISKNKNYVLIYVLHQIKEKI